MANLTAGQQVSITLFVGQVLSISGIAEVYIVPGQVQYVSGGRIGPFSSDVTLTLKAVSDVIYDENYSSSAYSPEFSISVDDRKLTGVQNPDKTFSKFLFSDSLAPYSPTVAEGLVSTYKTRVTAAGDTLTVSEVESLRKALSVLVKSTAFEKLRELWVPMGTSALTGAMVKIIADSTAGTSMVPTNLIAGDFSKETGITGNAVDKYITTGFNPTTAAVQTDGWGFGAYALNTTGSGTLIGTTTGFNSYLMYSTLNDSRMNNIQLSATLQYPRFAAVQANVTEVSVWHGGAKVVSAAYASASLPNVSLSILRANASNYSNQSVCGYAAWGVPMTSSELNDLAEFFDSINYYLGRLVFKASISACGDSNARGYVPGGGTAVPNRWSALVASAFSLTDNNSGVDDSTMSNDASGGTGGWIATRKALGTVAKAPTIVAVMLGTNDARYNVTPENFEQDYSAWLQYQADAGFRMEQFILCSPIAATDVSTNKENLIKFSAIIERLACLYGCKFYDAYTSTKNAAGIWQSDNLHLNQAGHDLIAIGIKSVIRQDFQR